VFDAILDEAMSLCEAAHGHIWIYDGERVHLVAVRGEPRFVEWMRRRGSIHPDSRPGRPSPLGRVVRGEPIAHVADAREEEAYRSIPMFREQVDVGGVRALLDIGLRKGDALLGIIALYRQEVRPFSEKQIALLQSFAAQAVIAMENARLLTETREALEQQTATAEVLQVINSSPGDLTPVFDSILDRAVAFCDAAFGTFLTYDGKDFALVASRGIPAELVEYRTRNPVSTDPDTVAARLRDRTDLLHIPDLMAEDAYRDGNPDRRAFVDLGGARTALGAALRKDRLLLGQLFVFRQEVRPFTDKQIALLQNFAAQAVIAMENARLLTETREALGQQTATAEVLQVINSSPGDLAPVFEEILDKAHALCGAAYGGLLTYDGDAFQVAAARGDARFVEYWRQAPIRPPEGTPLWRVMRGEGLVQIIDAPAEDSYHSAPPYARLIDLGGVRTFLSLPLRKDDVLLGVITAFRQEVRPFADKQIALLQNFAVQAVIAMENARLLTETREALEQ